MKRKGFTLVELLVVISIIAILMAVMMPALGRTRKIAQKVVCGTNLKQWGVIWSCYNADNNGSFSSGIPAVSGMSNRGEWAQTIIPYVNHKLDIFLCPTAKKDPADSSQQHGDATHTHKIKAYNVSSDINVKRGSYGANLWMYNLPAGYNDIQKRPKALHWGSIYKVKTPDNVPLMLDATYVGGGPYRDNPESFSPPPSISDYDWWTANQDMAHFVVNRHLKATNAVFMDGSVKDVKLKGLWNLKWYRSYNTNGPLPDWEREAPWMANF